ncbi:MAG: TetR/AcrR family transcriptional regulator [Rhizobiales bacterium]|nr:TetR/AcrR family transcriptional regulator [Hyphomicrobiales bacterium]
MIAQSERRAATIAAILGGARKLFLAQGFAETSVDAIALEAGVGKGAVYHHFESKEEILDRLVDAMQAEIAAEVVATARKGRDVLDSIGRGTLKYLTAITSPAIRRVLLIDGPAVLGWERWREIDHKYFAALMRGPLDASLRGRLSEREVEAVGHLVAGAMMEAALVCATSDKPERAARDMTDGLLFILRPLLDFNGGSPHAD